MAAATAAALGSRLGVVGTIAGAAVLSVVSAIAGSLYTNSMSRARDVVLLLRSRRDSTAGRPAPAVPVRVGRGWCRPDLAARRRTLATAGAVFALAAAFLAGLQLATGAPVTGTDLGGRTAAGVVVDGSAEPASGTRGDGKLDDGVTTPSPTGTAPGTRTGTATASGAATGVGSAVTDTPTATTGATPQSGATTAGPAAPGAQTPAVPSPTTPAAGGSTQSTPGTTGTAGATVPTPVP